MRYLVFVLVFGYFNVFSQNTITEFQNIPSNGANDFKSFKINGETFLALANYMNNSSVEINSHIYKWNGTEFDLFQEIPTLGASDWEAFYIDSVFYIAVANYKNNETNRTNSIIYKWNGDSLINYF